VKYYLPDHLIDIIHLVCIWHSDQLGLLGWIYRSIIQSEV
jgi:hypothetical protein